MNVCEIFFSENDELTELFFQEKRWRGDIIVKIDDSFFQPTMMTPARLLAEFNNAISEGQVYNIDQKYNPYRRN